MRSSLLLPKVEASGMSDEDSLNDNASVISTVSGSTICEDTRNNVVQQGNYLLVQGSNDTEYMLLYSRFWR